MAHSEKPNVADLQRVVAQDLSQVLCRWLHNQPLAIAIIGDIITSTLLTQLVVPTFYDSIEIARDRAIAKFHARSTRGNPLVAFVLTLGEAVLALVLLRFGYRALRKSLAWMRA